MADNLFVDPVAQARIGSPAGWFVLGIISLVVGGMFSVVPDARAFAEFLVTAGAGMIAVGFWVLLFGRIEQRLMDVQRAVLSFREPPAN